MAITSEALGMCVCVNEPFRITARKCGCCQSSPWPVDRKFSDLTTMTQSRTTLSCMTVGHLGP